MLLGELKTRGEERGFQRVAQNQLNVCWTFPEAPFVKLNLDGASKGA